MIDYIIVPQHIKRNLVDARSYNNLETHSDHRLVICKIKVANYLMYKPRIKANTNKKYDIQTLIHDTKIKEEYSKIVQDKINLTPNPTWNNITNILHESTKQCVGYINNNRNKVEYSKEIEKLSNMQKEFRIKISNSKNIEHITKLRRKRNQTTKQIQEKQKQIRNKNIDKIIHTINTAQNDKKMYEATKTLHRSERKENMFVYDKEGKCITNEKKVNRLIKEHFSQSLYDDKKPEVQPFRGEPRALNEPITVQEVSAVINNLSNNKAPGEDQIQVEMIKYGPPILIQNICRILNEIFEKHIDQVNINKSILIPAQKINKTKGPITHLRAINLLNTIRKVMSGITLKRISSKGDGYL